MATILLAIKPEYSQKILNGTKVYEYRKKIPNEPVDKIIIYESAPTSKVVGEAKVVKTIKAIKLGNANVGDAILNATASRTSSSSGEMLDQAGIDIISLENYFFGCDTAYAYVLSDIKKYKTPKSLKDFNIKRAPQNYCYIKGD